MYSNGLPFEPIEGRQVVNASYKAKGNSKALSYSGNEYLTGLSTDVLILLFQKLELKELACMSVSCKKFNNLVPNSRIWLPIAEKIGCFLSKDEPAYVQVVGFIQQFVSECWKWKLDRTNLCFRNLGSQLDAKIDEYIRSKKMSFELLRMVDIYEEAYSTALISSYLIAVDDNSSIGNYAETAFARQDDPLGQANHFKNSLFSRYKQRLEKLQVLDLSGYRVPHLLLQEILKIAKLSEIKLSRCKLVYFPENLLLSKNVKTLILTNNSIKEIPGSITALQNLENLHLNGNELQTLPNMFGSLPKLASLDISGNQLATLPSTMGNLRNLKNLTADNNHFQTLPTELLQLAPQLQKLSISNNPMKITSKEMKVLHSAKQVTTDGLPRQSSIYLRYQLLEDIKRVAKYSLLTLVKGLELSLIGVVRVVRIVEVSVIVTTKIVKALFLPALITIVFFANISRIALPSFKLVVAALTIISLSRRMIDARN